MQYLPETYTPLAQRSSAGEEMLAEKRTDAIVKGAYYIYMCMAREPLLRHPYMLLTAGYSQTDRACSQG